MSLFHSQAGFWPQTQHCLATIASLLGLRLFGQKPMGREALSGLTYKSFGYMNLTFPIHLGSPSIPIKAHHNETLSAPNKKFRWKIFEQKLDLSPRQDPSSWWRYQRVEAMRTEKRRSRWLWERPIFWGEGRGMSTGSKWWITKPKQIKDPKLPIRSIHKEHCQERTQQGEEEWEIVTLLTSQRQG